MFFLDFCMHIQPCIVVICNAIEIILLYFLTIKYVFRLMQMPLSKYIECAN